MIIARREVYRSLITSSCNLQGVDPKLTMAICEVESSWQPYAVRYEPHILYTEKPYDFAKLNFTNSETENELQKFSWGLGQLLGTTSRMLGFKGPLPSLCVAETGLYWTILLLKKLAQRYSNVNDQISAYNRGSAAFLELGEYKNQAYVDKVNKVIGEIA